MRKLLIVVLMVTTAIVAVPTSASADVVALRVRATEVADGAQEVPPVVTGMTGFVRATVTPDLFQFRLRVTGNTNTIMAAHVHCAAPGANGPVGISLFAGAFTNAKGTVAAKRIMAPNPGNGCGWADMTDVALAVLAGEAYVNVHTMDHPGGEVRADL